jgi:predicted PurR-regulated permease PerM
MSLTLNQFLFLILTFAAVVAVTFLVIFLIQLRKTAKETTSTMLEIRSLVKNLNDASLKINTQFDDLQDILEATKKTATGLSEAAWFLAVKIIRPSSKYWPLIYPLIRLGWRQLKRKKKEG